MSEFLQQVESKAVGRPGKRCSVLDWLDANPDVTVEDLRAGRERATLKAVWMVMQDRGFEQRPEAVSRHLRGDCSCRS